MFDLNTYNELKKAHIKSWVKLEDGAVNEEEVKACNALRIYLDSVGMKMPKPKYKYDVDNISTWKFLDGRISYSVKHDLKKYKNVYNPNFKYGHIV